MIKKLKYEVNVGLHLERGDKWVLKNTSAHCWRSINKDKIESEASLKTKP